MNRIRRVLVMTLAVLCASTVAIAMAQEAQQQGDLPSVDEVNEHLDELYRADSSHAQMTMTIITEQRGERELELEAWTQGEDNALFVIRAPAREAGTATLRTEEGLWNYAPRADRLVRVPTGMLSDAWMGSHLTNDDLVQETGFREDYDVQLRWDDADGDTVLVADMTPREGAPVIYTRVRYVLDAEDWTPQNAEFFDGEELMRTLEFSDVREVDDRLVPHQMVVLPATDPGESTTLQYEDLAFGVDIDASIFTRRGLRRVAR